MSGVRARFLKGDEIISRLKESAASLIARKEEILEISLFGSLARGDYGIGSDADIYILLKNDARRFTDRIAEFGGYFSGAGVAVEVFPYTVDEIRAKKDEGFMRTIEKE
ncbi:MAG TPA: nucleotidyltransferase domain-containing protein, partial [Thermodesulfobacteriota bacterium]|nr:nucleotidyltransferase domain-containing protein [Thermodesulfobacteriota bacterium]